MSARPFACDMGALTPDERAGHISNVVALFGAVARIGELDAGYAFHLPLDPGRLARAAEFIALERRCCPFFDFTIEVPADEGTLRLSVTGPDDVKPFVRAEFGRALAAGIGFPGA